MASILKAAVVGAVLVGAAALAQGVEVQTGDGKTVKVGTGAGGVEVQTGKKSVKVKTDGEGDTTVEVKKKGKSGTVKVSGDTVEVENGAGKAVKVKTGGGTVEVQKRGGGTVVVNTPDDDGEDEAGDDNEGGIYSVHGQGSQRTHACTPGQEVEVSGQGHTLTLTGDCGEIGVSGQGNQVLVDVAAAIKVSGVDNSVAWKSGPRGKKPRIKKSGINNAVKQLK